MTNTWKKVVVVIALLGASSLVSARAAVTVYAEETETSSNAVVATAEAPVETNAPATTSHRDKKFSADADHPPVRIDETGVHVGGPNPVDINVPDLARRRGEWGMSGFHLTSILAVIGTFGMPVAIIVVIGYFSHRRNKLAHETMRAMIEKGMPMTPELIAEIRSKSSGSPAGGRTRRLLPGLVLAGIGTALLISGSGGDRKGGWIVLFIGIAFLIVWFVEQQNQNNSQPPR
jgi:hypothetical protein